MTVSMGRSVVGEVKIKVSFDSGKAKKETANLNRGIANLTKGAQNLGRGFERFGRTISITGFVTGIVARRIIGSFEGIAKSIVKISEEGANLDRAMTFLNDTLSALALSGVLTEDIFNRVMGTFWDMFRIAQESAGSWAIVNDAIQQFKNAIAWGALPSLKSLAEFLLGFDLTPFTDALRDATNAFLTPIIEKIKELLGDENSGVIGIKEKLNAVALLGGNFLAGVLEGFDQIMIKAAELIGGDQTGMTGLASKFGEFAAWALVLAPAGAVVGMIVGGFGTIITAISGLIGIIGAPGAAGLLLVLGAVLADFEGWQRSIGNLITAVDNLGRELGVDLTGALNLVNGALGLFSVIIRTPINLITRFLEMIAAAIRKIKELASLVTGMSQSTETGGLVGDVMSRQGGGRVPVTDKYLLHAGERVLTRHEANYNNWSPTFYINGDNAERIADAIDRRLSQRSRSPYRLM